MLVRIRIKNTVLPEFNNLFFNEFIYSDIKQFYANNLARQNYEKLREQFNSYILLTDIKND